MSGFQGSDVDALDTIAGYTEKAADFATLVAGVLEAVAAVLEAFSWTGWAAAFAKYLRAVVIPWVKAAAKMLSSASQFLALMSGKQKGASGDTPQLGSGSTPGYQVPKLPTVSTGDAPQVATITITVTAPVAGGASAGVQVSTPSLTGTGPVVPGQVVGADGSGGRVAVPAALVGPAVAGGVLAGAAAARAVPAAASAATLVPASVSRLGGGGATGGGGTTGGGASGSGLGLRAAPAGSSAGDGPGVATTSLGGSGTGATGASSDLFSAGGPSGSVDRVLPAAAGGDGGPRASAAVLAAPLGVLGLGAAALSAHAARTASSATSAPEPGTDVPDDGSTPGPTSGPTPSPTLGPTAPITTTA
jgi:hypothetical protein